MLNKIFSVVLVLTITGLFRFVGPILGTSIATISMLMMFFLLIYSINSVNILAPMKAILGVWFVLLVLWPILSLLYTPLFDIRQVAICINSFLLVTGVVAFSARNAPEDLARLFKISLLVTYFGILLNLLTPDLFNQAAILADASVFSSNRPGGFFLQPNDLAIGLVLIFWGFLAFGQFKRTVVVEPLVLMAFFTALLLTGSRTGVLLAAILIFLHLGSQFLNKGLRRKSALKYLVKYIVIIFSTLLMLAIMRLFISYYSAVVEVMPGGLLDRMDNMLQLQFSDANKSTGSLSERREAQTLYLKMIKDAPFFGYGLGSQDYFLRVGALYKSAHSSFLSMTMEFGGFYAFTLLIAFAALVLKKGNRRVVQRLLETNVITQFLVISAVLLIFVGDIFDRRYYAVALGVALSLAYNPNRTLCLNAHKGKPYLTVR